MRLLLLAAFVAAATAASWSDGLIGSSAPRYTRAANYYGPVESGETLHQRVKRSFLAAINGFRKPCEPGWTGAFCENPICHDRQDLTPVETDLDKNVDIMYLPENCLGEYYLPVDSTTEATTIIVSTERGFPIVNLTSESGELIVPDRTNPTDGRSETVWFAYPGAFVLSIDMQGVPTKSCIVHILARSRVTFDGGFVNAPQGDKPPYGESGENNTPNYFIAHPFGLESPSEVRTVTIRNIRFLGAIYRSTLTRRYDCAYEYYAGAFTCNAGDYYLYIIEGLDSKGFPFRRARIFACYAAPTPPPPTGAVTTPLPVSECFNGGSLLTFEGTAFCFCPELFTGRQCTEAQCMNGGIQRASDPAACDCQPGYVGRNCENVVCVPNVGQILTDLKTLTVVIRNSRSMSAHIERIMAAIDEEVLNNLIYGRAVYDDFVLASIKDGVVTSQRFGSRELAQFGVAVERLAVQFSEKVACTESIYPAIMGLYDQVRHPQSPVFIFTDAVADQEDFDGFRELMRTNAHWRLRLHTFFLPQYGCTVDKNNDRGFKYFHDLGRVTGGLVHAPANDDDMFKVFVGSMRGTTYGMNLLDAAELKTCLTTGPKPMIIDASAVNFTIIATGKSLTVTLTDPKWARTTPPPYYTDGDTWFWHIDSPMAGEWLYELHSDDITTSCSYRFHVQSQYDLFLGTTTSVSRDERTFEPVVGEPAHLVAQINGLYGGVIQDQFRLFSEILIRTADDDPNDLHRSIFYSNGIFRSSCGFHLYFGIANFCEYEDQVFYAFVFADDPNGNPVQRLQIGYCSGRGGPTPSPDSCQNGGVMTNGTQCWCPAHFTGRLCEVIECQNGGTPVPEDQAYCRCPYNVAGRFCEKMECRTQNLWDADEADPDFRTLAIIISTKYSMKAAVKNLADRAEEFARNVFRNNPKWIDNYVILTANQTYAGGIETYLPGNFAARIRYISDNFDSFSDPTNTDCNVRTTAAVALALENSWDNSHFFVFADSQSRINDSYWTYYDSYYLDLADSMHTTVTWFGTDDNVMCDGSGKFGQEEQDIATYTGGKTLYLPNTDRIFTYINTFYSNGIVYEQDSISGCNAGVYFPVESLAHSIIFTVSTSPNATVVLKVTPPDDNAGMYLDTIIQGSQVYLEQYITACDPQFDSKGEYCYKYVPVSMGYPAALVNCANTKGGAALVDIFSDVEYQEVYDEISGLKDGVWLGLYRDSSNGQWVWLAWGANPIPLDLKFAKKYWGPGQEALIDNTNYVHVWMSPDDGKWYFDNTDGKHFAVCQKHRYGGTFNPASAEPDLPPGMWKLDVSSTDATTCSLQIRMQSDIQVYYGFTTDIHNDYTKGSLNLDSKNNFVVAHAIGTGRFEDFDVPEGRVDYTIVGAKGLDLYPLAMTERSGCTFDAISKISIGCPSTTPFKDMQVKFQGIDQYGYPFMRFGRTRCDRYVTDCRNGGVLHNGECICAPHYAGVDCRTVICENRGVALANGSCNCTKLWTGMFCEQPVCDPPYPMSFPVDGRTLTIIFDLSFEMKVPLFYMTGPSMLKAFGDLTSARPGWFKNFNFVPFDSTKNQAWWKGNTTMSDNYTDIWNAMASVDVCVENCDNDCPRPIASVLTDVLNDPKVVAPDSVIVVVTHSAIEDYTLQWQVIPLLISKRVHVHFILAGSSSPCSLGWGNAMNDAMRTFASFSVGSINNIPPKQIPHFFGVYLPTLYKAQDVVMDATLVRDCVGREHVFQIDHSTEEFTLEFFGAEAANMTIVGPNENIQVPASSIPGSGSYIGVFKVSQTSSAGNVPGAYAVRTTNEGAGCNVRVRASSSIMITPGFIQVTDTINGQSQDDAHYTPLRGQKNGIVLHVEGLTTGKLEYIQMATSRGNLLSTRDLKLRDAGCTYTYVMDGTFDCEFTEFEIVVYGVDNKNSPFHRNFKASCDEERVRPDPPAPWCDLNTEKVDITFLMDSSKDNQTLSMYRVFISHMMDKFTLGADKTQVAAYTISASAGKGGFFPFNKGNNQATFVDLANGLYADGTPGQNVANATSSLMRDVYKNTAGYRKSTAKHLLIYLTSTEPTDVDPIQPIQALINSATTGVAVVTYDLKNPSNKVLGLVERRCLYQGTEDTFVKYGVRFVQDLICRRSPICGM